MPDDRYSKITRRMWSSADFRSLSKPQPNGQSLWKFLLTGLHNTAIPGLFVLGIPAMADALGWDVEATRACFQELRDRRMATIDADTRLVWIPQALNHNRPTSVNLVLSWGTPWSELPACDLLRRAAAAMHVELTRMSQHYADAFAKVAASALPKPLAKPLPSGLARPLARATQEQDQDQEQDPLCEVDPDPETVARAQDDQRTHTEAHLAIDLDGLPEAEPVIREHVAALVRAYHQLAPLDNPEHIEHLRFVCFDHKLRFGGLREAFRDWIAKRAPACKHMPAEKLVGEVGSFLANVKFKRGGRPAPNSDAVAEHAELVTEYGKRWKRVHKRSRVPDKGDEAACGELLKSATAEAGDGTNLREIVLSWFDQHLANQDRLLADQCHPLGRLPKMLSQYEVKRPKPKAAKPEGPAETQVPFVETAETRAAREDCARQILGPRHPSRPLPSTTPPPLPPSPDVGAQDPPRAHEGPSACQQSASPICNPDRAGPEPPGPIQVGQVVSLLPRLRGGAR